MMNDGHIHLGEKQPLSIISFGRTQEILPIQNQTNNDQISPKVWQQSETNRSSVRIQPLNHLKENQSISPIEVGQYTFDRYYH